MKKIVGWRCTRCVHLVKDGRCRCATSPSPWEPIYKGGWLNRLLKFFGAGR